MFYAYFGYALRDKEMIIIKNIINDNFFMKKLFSNTF